MARSDSSTLELLDIHRIEQILLTYAIAIDTRNPGLLDRCFAKDAQIILAGLPVLDRAGYQRLCEGLSSFDATQHFVGAPVIQVTGTTARSRAYFMAQHVKNALAPKPFLMIGGWYDDELTKQGDDWRIVKRTGTAAWYDGNPEVLGYPVPPGALEPTTGRECPSWLLRS